MRNLWTTDVWPQALPTQHTKPPVECLNGYRLALSDEPLEARLFSSGEETRVHAAERVVRQIDGSLEVNEYIQRFDFEAPRPS